MRLLYNNNAYVGKTQQATCIKEVHESRLGGHMGITKTIDKVKQVYDFPGLRKRVEEVFKDYDVCQRGKAVRHKPYGLL